MREITYAQAVNEGIREEMRRDPKVVIMGEDVGEYGGVFGVTRGLYEEFGGARVRDCPLNEAAIVGFGVGLAMMGRPTIAEIEFMDFVTFAMDAIVNQAAKLRYCWGDQINMPLVVRMPIAAQLGFGSQHSQSLEAWFMHIPGLRVAMPSNAYDAKGLIKSAIRDPNPVVFIENVSLYGAKTAVPEHEYEIPFGKADIKRAGRDVTVVATSSMVNIALKAAEELAAQGVDVEVIDPLTLAPLDIDTIVESVMKTGRLVVAHLAHKTGGIGAEIAQQVTERAFDYLDGPVVRVAAADVPVAASQTLEKAFYPTQQDIVKACLSFRG
ncbi:MAG: alpha-ketoacid dehydrogenase subunit beta [Burkholderiales bacterium]|nr:alpha-ketoacid dehydrogenase subunit beta [Anaerolineae bacterium]